MNRSPEQLHALVSYRLEQAFETLREANLLLDQSAWRGAQNRAYYAMFYAVLALLATRQLGSSKHSGVLGLFDRVQAIEELLRESGFGRVENEDGSV